MTNGGRAEKYLYHRQQVGYVPVSERRLCLYLLRNVQWRWQRVGDLGSHDEWRRK